MGELEALYRDVVLEHNRRPRNFRRLAAPCGCTDGVNPLCGDRLMVCLRLDGETVAEVAFEGSGCAIAVASASMLTEAVTGQTRAQALALTEAVARMLGGGPDERVDGDLAALAAVSAYPSRVKCATLAWEALRAGLTTGATQVSTEEDGAPQQALAQSQAQERDGY